MNKFVKRMTNGKWQFLLGTKDGETYWLEQASFDCDWYWTIGYVENYRGYGLSGKNWRGHRHFDSMFLKKNVCGAYLDAWNKFFDETPLIDDEIWQILELMKSAYTCREYSDMIHRGGSHITSRVKVDLIKNDAEYCRLNNEVIPTIMNEVYKILLPEEWAYRTNEITHKLKQLVPLTWIEEEEK